MVRVEHTNWFTIENVFVFAPQEPVNSLINLAAVTGEEMRYKNLPYTLIDFPGEYDLDWVSVLCFAGREEKLNYLLDVSGTKIAILQSPEILEQNTELSDAQVWLYTDDLISNKLDQLELEGERIKLQ